MSKSVGLEAAVSSSRRLLLALDEAVVRLEAVERSKREPIAIVGMSCRFPGGATDPDLFWTLLHNGFDAITEVPPTRWEIGGYYDSAVDAAGKMYTRYGGFVERVDQFDSQFFGISPREAVSLDPQQRLLLEVSWEALENAGQTRDKLAGSKTGVWIGITTDDYARILMRYAGLTQIDAYFSTGNALNAAAGRLSYFLGLQGPSMAIDTACSSSLVAIHLACQSLRTGECDLALAGGVNLILSPEGTIALCRARMMSSDGRCKTFDAAADGYVRGEGCGVLVLKRLSNALIERDNVLAVIRGSAVNQDGPSSGFTVPHGPSQQALIRDALVNANVEPSQIDYVEAHGTGTSLGDPIEVGALGAALGDGRSSRPLIIGSVKTNIGHLESAAGVAGLIKVVLALKNQEIPPHLHCKHPNPHIPWEKLPVVVSTEPIPWPSSERRRLAGVSSFGASGTNAHLIVEEAPSSEVAQVEIDRPLHLLTLSAKTKEALEQLAGQYEKLLGTNPTLGLGDVCFSANTGRSHFNHRLCLVAESLAEARENLSAFVAGRKATGVLSGRVKSANQPKVAFLFTGQGCQYKGMGRQLYDTQPTFRQVFRRCDEFLRPYLENSLLSILDSGPEENSQLDDTAYTQPALFSLEFALAELWKSWGIEPAFVMGHSVGEYVAACLAGVFSLEDGLKLIAQRGRLMQSLPLEGEMVAVFASEARVAMMIQPFTREVSIAAVNGPRNAVISGSRQAMKRIIDSLEEQGIKSKKLKVSHAFHSPLMEPMLPAFERVVSEVSYSPPSIGIVSNVTGGLATEMATPEYWLSHVRQPVRFATGIQTLHDQGCELFLEIGPQPTLLEMGRLCLPEGVGVWLPSLRPTQNEWAQLLQSLGELYVHGVPVDWQGFDRDYARHRVVLPNYPWQRQRHWIETSGKEPLAENTRTPTLRLLQQWDAKVLADQLAKSGKFSEDETKLLPKLLEALHQYWQREERYGSVKDWLYEIEWRPQREGNRHLPPDFLPAPAEISRSLWPAFEQMTAGQDFNAYWEVLNQLEALSFDYVVSAFQHMGLVFDLKRRFSTTKIAEQFGVRSQHVRLLGRLLDMLHEEGVLRSVGEEWEVVSVPQIQDPRLRISRLLEQCPVAKAELTLLERCGSRLADVLRGQQDPLQLLFPEGDFTTASSLYQDSPAARIMNSLLRTAVANALAGLPKDRMLRVLEIGAGTGGSTSFILPILPSQQTEYVFTDVSPLFVTQAQEKFSAYPFVRYQVLDIEQAPSAQGFDSQQYDLLVAANVLHATKDLRQTVDHVQELLAPGAMLLLGEGTAPVRFVDLIFGLTDGWWRFSDQKLRPRHPLIPTSQWQGLLEASGFGQTATLSSPEGILSKQGIIIAQAAQTKVDTVEKTPGHWLVLADGRGTGTELGRLLQSKGEVCTLVFPGQAYERLGEREFRIDSSSAADFERLIAALGNTKLQGVVHLWSLDAADTQDLTEEDLEKASQKGCGSALLLVQSLVRAGFSEPPSLWLVTRGVQPVSARCTSLAVAQSTVCGLGKVIAREHPEFRCVLVDLDPSGDLSDVQALFEELWLRDMEGEEQLAFRARKRYVSRLVRSLRQFRSELLHVRSDGTYLVTGGLGDIGLRVAQWLVERGAQHLVLLGRSGPSDAKRETLRALQQAGAQVLVTQADVSRASQVTRVLNEIEKSMPPLRGVAHCAGVFEDRLLIDHQWDLFARVFAPKVTGSWNLHTLTQDMALDFFVLFSSAASILGAPGLGNYVAANNFLDVLAHHRRAQGLPGLSINWGPWTGVGMANAVGFGREAQWVAVGVEPLRPQRALVALENLLQHDVAQAAVINVNWSRFLEQFSTRLRPRFLDSLSQVSGQSRRQISQFREQLEAVPAVDRRVLLSAHVRSQAARVLGWSQSERLDPRQGFFDLGMDSLSSMELRNLLQTTLGCSLPSTLTFKYPTVEALVDYLAQEVLFLESRGQGPARPVDVLTAEEQLSEDLVESSIAKELAELQNLLRTCEKVGP